MKIRDKLKQYISEGDFRLTSFFIIIFSILFALSILVLFIFRTTEIGISLPINTSIFSDYGSVVGGIVAAILSLASVLLLIQSINYQIRQNKLQSIESRFFQLVALHKDNVHEFESKGKQGKNVIIDIFDEYSELHRSVFTAYLDSKKDQPCFDKEKEVAEIAFYITFFGLDNNSFSELERRIKNVMDNEDFYGVAFKPIFLDRLIKEQQFLKSTNKDKPRSNRRYLPHDGHQSRLGHYFRHLFQTVKYIDSIPPSLLSYEEKYIYIKTLRAQLSTHEQALLFINSLSSLGAEWEFNHDDFNNRMITKYNLIKNIPLGFMGELDCRSYFPFLNFEFLDTKTKTRKYLEEVFN